MSLEIGGVELSYNSFDNDGYNYRVTSINPYDTNIYIYQFINIIADKIYDFIIDEKIKTSNDCGKNSQFLCTYLRTYLRKKMEENYIRDFDIGRLIIVNWEINDREIQKIEQIYGTTRSSIGRTYHELSYLKVSFEGVNYHIAIETTSRPLQFYVGTDIDFEKLIQLRYQCEKFFITDSCDAFYRDIVSGGTKRKRKTKLRSIKRSSKSIKRRPKSYP